MQTKQPARHAGANAVRGDVIVTGAVAKSPAEAAGFKAGDIFATFNAVPVQQAKDVYDAVQVMHVGQRFNATVMRGDQTIALSGAAGAFSYTRQCITAGSPTIVAPPDHSEFVLEFDAPGADTELTCHHGCTWHTLTLAGCAADKDSCPMKVDQNGTANR